MQYTICMTYESDQQITDVLDIVSFKCNECGTTAETPENLIAHIRRRHMGDFPPGRKSHSEFASALAKSDMLRYYTRRGQATTEWIRDGIVVTAIHQ